jgi:hypothetical protein
MMAYPSPAGPMAYPAPWYPPQPPPRPVAATVLSIIGGAFIVLGGCAEFLIGGLIGAPGGAVFGFLLVAGILVIGIGLAIILAGALLPTHVHAHVPIGIAIVVLSLVSIIGTGGFLIGLLLGVIGGGLAIAFSPYPSYPSYPYYGVAPYYGAPSYYAVPLAGYPAPYGPGAPSYGAAPTFPTVPGPASGPTPAASARGPVCMSCGKSVDSEAQYCSRCGQPIAGPRS